MKEAQNYQAEVDALAVILDPLDDAGFSRPTGFKAWTIEDVIGHLYMFDQAALFTLQSEAAFAQFYDPIVAQRKAGKTFLEVQQPWLNGLGGRELFLRWRENSAAVSAAYAGADPKRRVKWAGPDMSARSSITARHMETWSHGHTVFDALGQVRQETDRMHGICHLGVATFGWTHINRKLPVPDPAPKVLLTAPSGAQWRWHEDSSAGLVKGSASEFAQVVTQVRNIADTSLEVQGDVARFWMEKAQCFAGAPVDPPAPGSRLVSKV